MRLTGEKPLAKSPFLLGVRTHRQGGSDGKTDRYYS